jgi:hypothetical protein
MGDSLGLKFTSRQVVAHGRATRLRLCSAGGCKFLWCRTDIGG